MSQHTVFKTFLGGSSIFNFCLLYIIRKHCFEPLLHTRNSLKFCRQNMERHFRQLSWSLGSYQSGWEVEVHEHWTELIGLADIVSIWILNIGVFQVSILDYLHRLILPPPMYPPKSICWSPNPPILRIWPNLEIKSSQM